MSSSFLLDGSIRDWVLVPVFVVCLLITYFRDELTELMKKRVPRDLKSLRAQQILLRVGRFRGAANARLTAESIAARKRYYTEAECGGVVAKRADNKSKPSFEDVLTGLTGAQGLAQMVRHLEQFAVMAWVNYFWSGFVLIRLPFPLTARFRPLTQRGIELGSSLDVRYVSALSWYFLVLFGIRGLLNLLLGRGESGHVPDNRCLYSPFGTATASPLVAQLPQNVELGKRFHSENEFVQLLPNTSTIQSFRSFPCK